MTIGDCLEEIKECYLDGNVDVMANLGMEVIKMVKMLYIHRGNYPREGWLLCHTQNSNPVIFNREISLTVPLPDQSILEFKR